MSSSPANSIAESFNLYFGAFGIRISPEDVVVGNHTTIRDQESGWRITYRVDPDEVSMPTLEFYATNRWTNDRHARIHANGQGEHLEAIQEIFVEDLDDPKSFHERNAALETELRDRGLY